MSELKAFNCVESDLQEFCEPRLVYLKSEADKAIAELEESHKKEVGQLLMEIAGLKQKNDDYRYNIAVLRKEKSHQKHKRCLAMAEKWCDYAAFCGMQSHCHNHRGFGKTAEEWTRKEIHAWKCVKRWLKLAEKFETNSTAQ